MVVAWIWDLKQSIEGAMTACDGKEFQIRIPSGKKDLPNNQQCFNYAESTPIANSTRMQGPS
jgi:hypothetical protein